MIRTLRVSTKCALKVQPFGSLSLVFYEAVAVPARPTLNDRQHLMRIRDRHPTVPALRPNTQPVPTSNAR